MLTAEEPSLKRMLLPCLLSAAALAPFFRNMRRPLL